MKDPVLALDTHTYERSELSKWLDKSKTSPYTGKPMEKLLIFNRAIKDATENYLTELNVVTSELNAVTSKLNAVTSREMIWLKKFMDDRFTVLKRACSSPDETSKYVQKILKDDFKDFNLGSSILENLITQNVNVLGSVIHKRYNDCSYFYPQEKEVLERLSTKQQDEMSAELSKKFAK